MFNLGWFLLGIVILLYIACIIGSATLMLLVFVLGALSVVGACSVIWRCLKIKARLQIPIELSEKGRENLLKISVVNYGSSSLAKVKVLIVIKDHLRGRKHRYWRKLPVVHTGENEYVESVVIPEMGNYDIYLRKVRVYDLTGLVRGDVWTKSRGRIQVMPQMYEVNVLRTEATKNFYGEAEVYDERQPGYDHSEIFQIREYQRGDKLQNVHWKLTAKHDELVVKEHSLPRSCPVVLFLEYRPWIFGRMRWRLRPFMEAAAGLSFSVMDSGCPHYVVWYDKLQKDLVRVRVENEESMFYFIGILMKIRFGRHKGALAECYREKYRAETYVREYTLNEKLVLTDGEGVSKKLSPRRLEESLSKVELVL